LKDEPSRRKEHKIFRSGEGVRKGEKRFFAKILNLLRQAKKSPTGKGQAFVPLPKSVAGPRWKVGANTGRKDVLDLSLEKGERRGPVPATAKEGRDRRGLGPVTSIGGEKGLRDKKDLLKGKTRLRQKRGIDTPPLARKKGKLYPWERVMLHLAFSKGKKKARPLLWGGGTKPGHFEKKRGPAARALKKS